MPYRSYLKLNKGAEIERLIALIQALQAQAIKVTLHAHKETLEFVVAEREERWITIGGLARLLADFSDVVCWETPFEELDSTKARDARSLPL